MSTKLPIKRTSAKAGGHTDAISLSVNSEVAERCLKKAQARQWLPDATKRQRQSRTALEDQWQPSAEELAEERQPGRVVLARIEREQAKTIAHTCTDAPNSLYGCPGLAATRNKLVNLARWRGYSTAADDMAHNCFVAALKAKTTVNCLARFASHGRNFRWAVARQDHDHAKHERWAKGSAERQGLVMTWVKDEDGRDEGHWDGYIPQDEGLTGHALDRYLDLMAVIEASPRPHTALAVEQVMTGCKEMRAAGLPTLAYYQVSREMDYIRRDYEAMMQAGKARWQAELLFRKPA